MYFIIYMSEKVNLIIGTDTQINKEDNKYKDYIMNQNISLLEENKNLTLELKAAENRIEELEEESDKDSLVSRKLKQHVQNFYTVSEIYKDILDQYKIFTDKELEKYDRNLLIRKYKTNPFIRSKMMLNFVIFIVYNTFIYYFGSSYLAALNIIIVALYVYFIGNIDDSSNRQVELEKKFHDNLTELVKYRESRKAELDELSDTIDIIGNFMDNAI